MENKKTFFIIVIVLIVVLVGGVLLYNMLSNSFDPISPVNPDGNYTTAADFTINNNSGTSETLSQHFGKPIVVNVWATWCGPCVNELPHFQTLYNEINEDVTFIFVNLDSNPETARNFMANKGYSFPLYFDYESSLVNTYGVTSIPVTLFINANGELVHRQVGSMTETTLRTYIDLIYKC